MHRDGFKVEPLDWWDYNFISNYQFELLDIPAEFFCGVRIKTLILLKCHRFKIFFLQ